MISPQFASCKHARNTLLTSCWLATDTFGEVATLPVLLLPVVPSSCSDFCVADSSPLPLPDTPDIDTLCIRSINLGKSTVFNELAADSEWESDSVSTSLPWSLLIISVTASSTLLLYTVISHVEDVTSIVSEYDVEPYVEASSSLARIPSIFVVQLATLVESSVSRA